MNQDFLAKLSEQAGGTEFSPTAYYDADGDCIEFFLSPEEFRAERLDRWVTVYRGRESGQIVGSLIKNIKRELFVKFPGIDIDVIGERVHIKHLLRAPAYSTGDQTVQKIYRDMLDRVETAPELEAELLGCKACP
jgi:hypothetical protein